MPDGHNLTLTSLLAHEMGREAFDDMKEQIRETIEAETGVAWEWRPEFPIDAIRLYRVGHA